VKLVWDVYVVAVHYRCFWISLRSKQVEAQMQWRTDVWPLQWRIGVQSVFHYFAMHLFTPVMFHYHTAALAGRMGMTWTVLTALQAGAFAWVQTRRPLFGMLIARKDYRELDRVFFRLTTISFCVMVAAGGALTAAVFFLNAVPLPLAQQFADRMLPPLPTLIFTLAVILSHITSCMGVYIRAHKRDPLLLMGTLSSALTGLGVWYFGSRFGALAAAEVFLAVAGLVSLPWTSWIWLHARREWHGQA